MASPGGPPGDGPDRGPGEAERSLGEIVSEISQKASLLVREEIELAKLEVGERLSKLWRSAAIAVAAGLVTLLGLNYFLHGVAHLFAYAFGAPDGGAIAAGYLVLTMILLIVAVVAGLIAYRLYQRGSPPMPELAIEEAKKTREALEKVNG